MPPGEAVKSRSDSKTAGRLLLVAQKLVSAERSRTQKQANHREQWKWKEAGRDSVCKNPGKKPGSELDGSKGSRKALLTGWRSVGGFSIHSFSYSFHEPKHMVVLAGKDVFRAHAPGPG